MAQVASEWMKYANLKFDFGDGAELRTCQGGEAIKIDFVNTGPKIGYWSALGTLSLKVDHSMNLSPSAMTSSRVTKRAGRCMKRRHAA